MIRSLYRSQDRQIRNDLRPDEFAVALRDTNGTLWVDFVSEPAAECEPILRETFNFHPLAVDDALRETHAPKVDDWNVYLYIVLHAITSDNHTERRLATLELDVFLGSNYIVTYHDKPIPSVDHIWSTCQRDERHLKKGADHILYQLADELATSYMAVVEEIGQALEVVEAQIFSQPTQAVLEQILMLKRALLHLRRIITPQREVINKLARDDYGVIDAEDRVFFRDVYDHFVRLHDINESMRDLVGSTLDTYLSVVNNRMNEVMKTLTIITTLFMPISFIARFFGMNFFQTVTPLDVWTGSSLFFPTIGMMIFIPVGLYLWIRQRAWM